MRGGMKAVARGHTSNVGSTSRVAMYLPFYIYNCKRRDVSENQTSYESRLTKVGLLHTLIPWFFLCPIGLRIYQGLERAVDRTRITRCPMKLRIYQGLELAII